MPESYPQSEKLARISDERRGIHEFVEWLAEQGMYICAAGGESTRLYPVARTVDSMVLEMYEIDERELEQERRRMLRAAHDAERIDSSWTKVTDRLPPDDVPVLTVISDEKGVRNEAVLRRRDGLWYTGTVHTYYRPTHWKEQPDG